MLNKIPDIEFKSRIKKLQQKMQQKDLDIIITFGNESEPQYVRYFTDYWPSFETAGVFIPVIGEPILLIGPESLTFAQGWSRIDRIELMKEFRESSEPEYPGIELTKFSGLFSEFLSSGSNKKIGIVGYPIMPVPIFNSITEEAKKFGCEVVRSEELVIEMRQIKSENEITMLKNAAQISEKALGNVLDEIKPGLTEAQVIGIAEYYIRKYGAEDRAYPLFCSSGKNTNQAVTRPTHKVIEKNELIFLNIGARLGGYASSIGRPLVLGKPPQEVLDLMKLGIEANKNVISLLKEGIQGKEIDYLHRQFLKKNNAEDTYLYGPLHGIGLMENEHPWVEADADFIFKENMTFAACVYLRKENFGLRVEDVLRITKDGTEEFTGKFKEEPIIL